MDDLTGNLKTENMSPTDMAELMEIHIGQYLYYAGIEENGPVHIGNLSRTLINLGWRRTEHTQELLSKVIISKSVIIG